MVFIVSHLSPSNANIPLFNLSIIQHRLETVMQRLHRGSKKEQNVPSPGTKQWHPRAPVAISHFCPFTHAVTKLYQLYTSLWWMEALLVQRSTRKSSGSWTRARISWNIQISCLISDTSRLGDTPLGPGALSILSLASSVSISWWVNVRRKEQL